MNSNSSRRTLVAVVLALAGTLPVAAAGPAQASGGDQVVRRGSCTGSTHWKMKAKPDNGRIEVETEIDSNHNGRRWTWVLFHDGSVSARGASFTHAPSGSFTVTRRTVNSAGTDAFRLRARDTRNGEVCVARVKL